MTKPTAGMLLAVIDDDGGNESSPRYEISAVYEHGCREHQESAKGRGCVHYKQGGWDDLQSLWGDYQHVGWALGYGPPEATREARMGEDENGYPIMCLGCGGAKGGYYMCAPCWGPLGGSTKANAMVDEWVDGARNFPRPAAPSPAPAVTSGPEEHPFPPGVTYAGAPKRDRREHPASCYAERWDGATSLPLTALQHIQARTPPEPWRPSVDDWDLLPDADVRIYPSRSSQGSKR